MKRNSVIGPTTTPVKGWRRSLAFLRLHSIIEEDEKAHKQILIGNSAASRYYSAMKNRISNVKESSRTEG